MNSDRIRTDNIKLKELKEFMKSQKPVKIEEFIRKLKLAANKACDKIIK